MIRYVYHSLQVLIVFTGLLTVTHSSAQGLIDGFMRGKGNTTVALSYSNEQFRTYFVGDRPVTNTGLGKVTTQSASLFVGAGLTNYLDVVVSLPYISANPDVGYWQTQKGFQDLSVYLKYRPYQADLGNLGKVSTILALGVGTPVSDYVADSPIAIGHQSTNIDSRAVVHYATKFGLFATVQGGYIRKSKVGIDRGYEVSVPDVWDWSGKIGLALKPVYVDVWYNQQDARSGTNIGPGVPFPGNAISYRRWGFNTYMPIANKPKLGISFGMGFTLNGTNIGKATRYSVGLVYNLPSWKGL